MTFPSITSMIRNWLCFTEPRHPVVPTPRVFGTMPELAAVTRERDELRIALGTEERAHEAAAERCRTLTNELDLCRTGNRSLANEVRVLNTLLDGARARYRRARRRLRALRRDFCRTVHALNVTAVELEEARKRLGPSEGPGPVPPAATLPASMRDAPAAEVRRVVLRWLEEEGVDALCHAATCSEDREIRRGEFASLVVDVDRYWAQRRDETRRV